MTQDRYVYFIKPVGMDGPIKIGCSDTPADRLKSLAAWSPWPLELIGQVSATGADECFLHDCFLDLHSHHEWFRTSPDLRETIGEILAAGSIEAVRSKLTRKGKMRSRKRSTEQRRCTSFKHRIRWACEKLRITTESEFVYFCAPANVSDIMGRWSGTHYPRTAGTQPTEGELSELEAFLANPSVLAKRQVVTRIAPKQASAA